MAGMPSVVAAAGDRNLVFPDAELLPVAFSDPDRAQLRLKERLVDVVTGWAGRDRKGVARLYRPIGSALAGSDGPIIVHDGYLGAAGLATLRAMHPDRPLFLWMHNEPSPAYSPREVRRFISLADRVICVSDSVRDSMVRAARSQGIGSRLAVVLNGVDGERFRPSPQAAFNEVPAILFVGRVVRIKGPDLLASALSSLHAQGVDFRATFLGMAHPDVTGASRYERALRRQTAAFSDKVSFLPFRPNTDTPDVYRQHDVMVVPSRFEEPCSLALLEGMASGLAIVATRRGGMTQVGQDSIQYFEGRDQLANALGALLQDREMREQYAARARARALQLPWSRTFDEAYDAMSPALTRGI